MVFSFLLHFHFAYDAAGHLQRYDTIANIIVTSLHVIMWRCRQTLPPLRYDVIARIMRVTLATFCLSFSEKTEKKNDFNSQNLI